MELLRKILMRESSVDLFPFERTALITCERVKAEKQSIIHYSERIVAACATHLK